MSSITPHRPGILIVHPRLHDPTPENAAQFLRWTKLHNRDLLNIPETQDYGKIVRTARFRAADDDAKYGHGHDGGKPSLFYTVLLSSISLVKSPEYYAVSRRLDLENTRDLLPGEERVGCEEGKMVWDLVDAKFAVYEEVQGLENGISFKDFPVEKVDGSVLVAVGVKKGELGDVKSVQKEVVANVSGSGREVWTSLYWSAGAEGHPDMHPVVDAGGVGGMEWLILAFIVGEGLTSERINGMLSEWANDRKNMDYGAWGGELFMT